MRFVHVHVHSLIILLIFNAFETGTVHAGTSEAFHVQHESIELFCISRSIHRLNEKTRVFENVGGLWMSLGSRFGIVRGSDSSCFARRLPCANTSYWPTPSQSLG